MPQKALFQSLTKHLIAVSLAKLHKFLCQNHPTIRTKIRPRFICIDKISLQWFHKRREILLLDARKIARIIWTHTIMHQLFWQSRYAPTLCKQQLCKHHIFPDYALHKAQIDFSQKRKIYQYMPRVCKIKIALFGAIKKVYIADNVRSCVSIDSKPSVPPPLGFASPS